VDGDELSAPLGQTKKKKLPKLPLPLPQIVAGTLGLFGLVVVGWAAFVNDPLGGEPVAVVAAKVGGDGTASDASGDGKHHARHDGESGKAADGVAKAVAKISGPPPGSKTVTIIDGSSGQRKDVVIPGNGSGAAVESSGEAVPKAPVDRKLLDNSRHGAIPKIGPDGKRASEIYAQKRTIAAAKKDFPRIALVIGAMGISASGTAEAFAKLPPSVTFALAPYSTDVAKLAEHARAEGHEVLLQAPMEPFDYPDNDPGPQTLLTSLTPEQNVDRLHWLMSRFQGYVGIESYMGERFTATEQALSPVLREIAKRGLVFIDGNTSTRSVAGQIAGSQNLPYAKTDVVVDAVPTPIEIDRALARLEIVARDNGAAVGVAIARPGTVERIAAWAAKVEARGFVLVPVTMVAVKAKSS
jgi:polysaccharide deacetylase 2 family uncharacterized protein YibQ